MPGNEISWYDAAEYCNKLSEKEGIDKNQWCYVPTEGGKYEKGMKMAPNYLQRTGYRLPTEAEWEYALPSRCRDGIFLWRSGRISGQVWLVCAQFFETGLILWDR